jgi:hypothetical protein
MRQPLSARPLRLLLAAVGALAVLAVVLVAERGRDDGERLEALTVATAAPPTTMFAVPSTVTVPAPPLPPAPPAAEAAPADMAPRPTDPPPPPVAAPRRTPAPASAPAPGVVAPAPAPAPAADTADTGRADCVVWLHGKGGSGSATTTSGGIVRVAPTGNASAWGGREWRYFPESSYQSALGIVRRAVDQAGCGRVIVGGFSNGAAFAAKLYCRGENFGGRLVRVVVDDPVVDHAVEGCGPAGGVPVTLYWTGALGQAQPGWNCANGDWTCEGGSTIGIDAYAAALGTPAKRSPMGGHTPYTNAPELTRF